MSNGLKDLVSSMNVLIISKTTAEVELLMCSKTHRMVKRGFPFHTSK